MGTSGSCVPCSRATPGTRRTLLRQHIVQAKSWVLADMFADQEAAD